MKKIVYSWPCEPAITIKPLLALKKTPIYKRVKQLKMILIVIRKIWFCGFSDQHSCWQGKLHFKMKLHLNRLDYLCIEIIGQNINQYTNQCLKNQEKYLGSLGERIVKSSIANSWSSGVNENSFEFIFNHYQVEKFTIYNDLCEKIHNWDFLNNKYIKKLKIYLNKPLKLKNTKFLLTVDKLIIKFSCDDDFETESTQFLSNLIVREKLKVHCNSEKDTYLYKMEKMLLIILSNASKDLNHLCINNEYTTDYFNRNLTKILMNKKNLKKVYLEFSKKFSSSFICEYWFPFFENLSKVTILKFEITEKWNYQIGCELFKSMSSLENITIIIPSNTVEKIFTKVCELFNILEKFVSKKLKILCISLPKITNFYLELKSFLNSCKNLEKVYLFECDDWDEKTFNLNDSFQPALKSLKCFLLSDFAITTDLRVKNMINLFSRCFLNEIYLYDVHFGKNKFTEFLNGLQNSEKVLKVFSVKYCFFDKDELKNLAKTIAKFSKLVEFNLNQDFYKKEYLLELFTALESSYKTLTKIALRVQLFKEEIEENEKLNNFFFKSQNLMSIKIKINFKEDCIPGILLNLLKYQKTLEVFDVGFCYSKNYLSNLITFLSKCTNLKKISDSRLIIPASDLKKIIKALENSKYTLKKISFDTDLEYENYYEFPNLFLSKYE